MRVMADVGLRACEYETASSPAESILERPFAQFQFNIMDIKESAPPTIHTSGCICRRGGGGITRLVAEAS